MAGLWTALISGASMNPVRSFAPDLLCGELSTTWIYIAGLVPGALVGVGLEWILKNKPTAAGSLAAQGSFDEKEAAENDSRCKSRFK